MTACGALSVDELVLSLKLVARALATQWATPARPTLDPASLEQLAGCEAEARAARCRGAAIRSVMHEAALARAVALDGLFGQ